MRSLRQLHPASTILLIAASLGLFMAPESCCDDCCGKKKSRNAVQNNLRFEPNLGQADARYRRLARAPGMNIFLDESGAASLDLRGRAERSLGVLRVHYPGAAARPVIEEQKPEDQPMASPRVNYFFSADPSRWITDVPTFPRVNYREVYPGIDLVYHGNAGELEHDFVVKPGADSRLIRMEFSGAKSSRLQPDGSLRFDVNGEEIAWRKPVLYQRIEGQDRIVEGRYRSNADGSIGFEVGMYDQKRNLVIDPVVTFSTYLGRGSPDVGTRIATDASGNVYMTGGSFDGQFPISPGAVSSKDVGTQLGSAIITKLNAAGTGVVWSTYLGGINTDGGLGNRGGFRRECLRCRRDR